MSEKNLGNPENKEAPSPSEKQLSKDRTGTVKQVGKTAIGGATKK